MGGRKCQKFLLVDICEQKHLFQTYGRKMFINLKSNMKRDQNEAQGQRGRWSVRGRFVKCLAQLRLHRKYNGFVSAGESFN